MEGKHLDEWTKIVMNDASKGIIKLVNNLNIKGKKNC